MKTISLKINIPDDYKFMAVQPWGAITLFTKQPIIFSEYEFEGAPPSEYWETQDGEIDLLNDSRIEHLNLAKDWKNSIREI